MDSPRLFEILDRMNVQDAAQKTSYCAVSNTLLSSQESKQGSKVTIGGPIGLTTKIMNDQVYLLMLVIDRKTYDFTKAQMEKEVENG